MNYLDTKIANLTSTVAILRDNWGHIDRKQLLKIMETQQLLLEMCCWTIDTHDKEKEL